LGGHCEEVRTMLPIDILDVDQFEVGLVDKGSGLQSLTRALVLHLVSSYALQRAINPRRQLLERGLIAAGPCAQKLRSF